MMADATAIPKAATGSPRQGQGERLNSPTIWDGFFYWSAVIIPLVLSFYLFLQFWSEPVSTSTDVLHTVLYWSKYFWFTGALVIGCNLTGLLFFGSPRKRVEDTLARFTSWDQRYLLTLAYVSRGDNVEALGRAMHASIEALERAGANFRIEVVTDTSVEKRLALSADNISYYVVPPSYETPHHTKYKARALQYLVEARTYETPNTWILHMDEESTLTPSSIAGIHRFITNPEHHDTIGQGEIKYNAYQYGKNIFITAMDSVRTGDDLGRFRLQFALFHSPLFGMHGSFFLLPDHLERRIGFDLGRKGSVTEDAYFALIAKQEGVRFDWIDGFIREQSPFTIRDMLRQRRRWFCGVTYLSFDTRIALRHRALLMLFTILWSVAWVGPIVVVLNIMLGGGYFPFALTYVAALIQGGNGAIYLLGAYHNLEDSGLSLWKKSYIAFAALILLPLSSALEGLGVLWALLSPVKTFYVVKK